MAALTAPLSCKFCAGCRFDLGGGSGTSRTGGVILNQNQPNNLYYEQSDGLLSVYNGPNSAVAVLTPFLTTATGPAYTLASALAQASASPP